MLLVVFSGMNAPIRAITPLMMRITPAIITAHSIAVPRLVIRKMDATSASAGSIRPSTVVRMFAPLFLTAARALF